MSPTVKIGEPRIVSLTRCRRKLRKIDDLSSVNDALGLPLCVGCPALRNGPSTLPGVGRERSKLTVFVRMMFGPVSEPRACEPWQSMQSLAQMARPRSCAAWSTTGRPIGGRGAAAAGGGGAGCCAASPPPSTGRQPEPSTAFALVRSSSGRSSSRAPLTRIESAVSSHKTSGRGGQARRCRLTPTCRGFVRSSAYTRRLTRATRGEPSGYC